jgi:Ca2+-binding RTX toxin-like protein
VERRRHRENRLDLNPFTLVNRDTGKEIPMASPTAITTNSNTRVRINADSTNIGLITASIWSGQAVVKLNGVDVPIQGENGSIIGIHADSSLSGSIGVVAANTRLYGNFRDNVLFGSNNSDYIDGFGGNDLMQGLAGNDTYVYRGNGGRIVEADEAAGGYDTILTEVNFTEADWNSLLDGDNDPNTDGFIPAIEEIQLRGGVATALEAVGTKHNNTLDGNEFNNFLSGLGGADKLNGFGGNDTLLGGEGRDGITGHQGNDSLSGGTGNDRLTGGRGNDTVSGDEGVDRITYSATALGQIDVVAGTADVVLNGAGDFIDFEAGLEAQLFTQGVALSEAEGDLLIGSDFGDGGNIRFTGAALQIDLNSDGLFVAAEDFEIALTGVSTVTYSASADYFLLG